MSKTSGKRNHVPEGPWAKAAVVLAAVTLILSYFLGAAAVHWPPFASSSPTNSYQPDQRTLLLSDPLTSTSGRWVNKSAGTGTCDIRPDGLHAAIDSKHVYHECSSKTSATNFTFEVTFKFGSATGAGIFFRAVGPGSWYNAQFSKDGKAYITVGSQGNSGALPNNLPPQQLARPDLDVPHTLAVVAVGDVITFYVDHEQALTTTDSTYSSGFMGVYAVNAHPGGETVFRNAVIWGS